MGCGMKDALGLGVTEVLHVDVLQSEGVSVCYKRVLSGVLANVRTTKRKFWWPTGKLY